MKETSWSEILREKLDEEMMDWGLTNNGFTSARYRSDEGVTYEFYIFQTCGRPYLLNVDITKRCYKDKKRLFRERGGLKSTYCALREKDFSKTEWKMLGKKTLEIYKNLQKGESEMQKKREKDAEDEIKNYILKERGK